MDIATFMILISNETLHHSGVELLDDISLLFGY